AHWAAWAQRTRADIRGALLATPPDFETPMPEGYPTMEAVGAAGWLPVPRAKLPFRSLLAARRGRGAAARGGGGGGGGAITIRSPASSVSCNSRASGAASLSTSAR